MANIATILLGLWLVYRAIFSVPPGDVSQIELAAFGVVLFVLALWARRSDLMRWHSATNIALAAIVVLLAAARPALGIGAPQSFWILLLAGVTAATVAMWSLLHRPDPAREDWASASSRG